MPKGHQHTDACTTETCFEAYRETNAAAGISADNDWSREQWQKVGDVDEMDLD